MVPPGASSGVPRRRAISPRTSSTSIRCCSIAYLLFYLELGRRRIWITGVPTHSNPEWVTQQAETVTGDLTDADITARFTVCDRDTPYVASFDEAFGAEDTQILKTPYRTPNANAFAGRFVRTVRSECLDHLLVMNERHLERILRSYTRRHNGHRPHQGLSREIRAPERTGSPLAIEDTSDSRYRQVRRRPGRTRRHDGQGGLIHEYERAA